MAAALAIMPFDCFKVMEAREARNGRAEMTGLFGRAVHLPDFVNDQHHVISVMRPSVSVAPLLLDR
jgi:hypothetical protein